MNKLRSFHRPWTWIFPITIILALVLLCVVTFQYGIPSLWMKKRGAEAGEIVWEDMAPSPLGYKGYTPQGMTYANGKILIANTWKNRRSRVYEYNPGTMEIKRHFDMPRGAVHTSGLAWDGEYLWGVDYISNRAYRIKLEPSLTSGDAVLHGSFDTTLKGTSACCIVPYEGKEVLAISDFMRTRKTIFVDMDKALEKETAAGAIEFYYYNEGFSQGLTYFDGHLYESENKWGINVINKYDLECLFKTKKARKSTLVQYKAPERSVEDLAWDGKHLWTSDEKVFRIFRGKFKEITAK